VMEVSFSFDNTLEGDPLIWYEGDALYPFVGKVMVRDCSG
jgi:hypothetical protein